MELATLRELPVQNGVKNDMYDVPTYDELNALPKISRSQIVLTRFIGEATEIERQMNKRFNIRSRRFQEAAPLVKCTRAACTASI